MVNIFDIQLYKRENGRVPVEEFLHSLPPKLRAKAYLDIELLEKHGKDLREPYVKPVKGRNFKGLYELRIKFAGDIARIFYFVYYRNQYVLLSGFIKKTMKTPVREIKTAKQYMEDYKRRCEDEEEQCIF